MLSFGKNVLFFIITISLFSCSKKNNTNKNEPLKPSNLSGKVLAQTYCASCHLFPEPNLLDKKTWQNSVLPKMYARLGLEEDSFTLFANIPNNELQIIANSGIYPEQPLIAKEDWAKIVKFYIENSPENPLPQDNKVKVRIGLENFKIKNLYHKGNSDPMVTFVKFDTAQNNLYVGNRGASNYLKKYNQNFIETDSFEVKSPISDIIVGSDYLKILTMGIMDPNDQRKGQFIYKKNGIKANSILLDSLQRPVNIEEADLNQDNIKDIIICNFGNELGKLIWIDGKTKKENILIATPGARKVFVKDMNNDKLPDLVALMTQAKEQVVIFFNKGNKAELQFEEKSVLQFPPVYGSSYIDLADFDKDGFLDILYSNGDNADLSNILKKYHGIRLFKNDGNNNFKQTYFYPMYGAAKAVASDFDLDGDLDIAAISFFPDINQKPNEGFLLLVNAGDNKTFKPTTFATADQGKWMVMDVADMDRDGDLDIVLGSFFKPGLQTRNNLMKFNKKLPFSVILENKTK